MSAVFFRIGSCAGQNFQLFPVLNLSCDLLKWETLAGALEGWARRLCPSSLPLVILLTHNRPRVASQHQLAFFA